MPINEKKNKFVMYVRNKHSKIGWHNSFVKAKGSERVYNLQYPIYYIYNNIKNKNTLRKFVECKVNQNENIINSSIIEEGLLRFNKFVLNGKRAHSINIATQNDYTFCEKKKKKIENENKCGEENEKRGLDIPLNCSIQLIPNVNKNSYTSFIHSDKVKNETYQNYVLMNEKINMNKINSVGKMMSQSLIENSNMNKKWYEIEDDEKRKKKSNIDLVKLKIQNYLDLSKSKLTLWVTINSTFGYFMLGGNNISELLSLSCGIFLCSSSANTFNQIIEKDIDKLMNRTNKRPLACINKNISLAHAKIFGCSTAAIGCSLLYYFNNPLTSFLGLFNILLYTCLYTPLKRKTPYNTHVGSIVGSIPMLMGCAAIEQNLFIPEAWILFSIQLLWQFPHFYSLAYLYKEDYLKGKYKMFPLKDNQNGLYTARLCRPYLILLSCLPFLFFFCGYTSYMYILSSLIPNIFIYYKFQQIFQKPSKKGFRSFFKHSLWHIILLLALSSYHTQIPDKKTSVDTKRDILTNEKQIDKIPQDNINHSEHPITKFKKRLLKFCVVFS
ncbi:cytochrome c oxidase assembly protein, putative [Plasmodium berghei]|uniref:Heme O synthase n=2 Tax=Plasmodium berghei TaxID=5821 RepID=A0A509AMM1_PLABA|nr:protoheme IX farnesyltransferase, putative [Plasmodium berghei ANKA]CXI81322.1 cytochrome c oxidase assembly protein, putative [Plasmodium berghei]SCM25497.1 cytochrome c oxidase assembly protein, putative [Plasmodium berghei]SCN27385.1 cytochrome c oxidase assembly protein, putative [Plasmodium berghei]SCO63811.1 cytochrome c oxidase assembly protein, putative [Plasmodium berghei]VUC57239.1 protoheme IX farnesyltransferase, putative [Plasmodium berghei ANKA]|eukprot:XP_034423018.1 protoheme IX farnesyltransferase, putative [Plasmodium berghei ANKA]